MEKVKTAVLAVVLTLGVVPARALGLPPEDLPTPPHLEFSSAWLAQESEDYWKKSELQPFMAGPQSLDLNNWESLKQLSKGKNIRVVDGSLKKIKGRFIEANEHVLKFKANGKEMTLDRANVRMVSLRLGPSLGQRILMGLLAGALIGVATWAEASQCEEHGCWKDDYGWYEGSGKGFSARSGYIAAGAGAAGLGILAAFAKTEDVVIYFQQPKAELVEVPVESSLVPFEAGQPEGGNVFAPVGAEVPRELPIDRKLPNLSWPVEVTR